MRLLIAAHRDEVALDHEDVGGLQDRVPQEAVRGDREVVVAHLVLEGRDPLGARNGDEHREIKEELGDLGDQRLEVDRAPLWIDPDREIVGHELADVLADLFEVGHTGREHVVIGDQEKAVVLVLELHPVLERSVVVAQVEALGGGPVTREDALPRLQRGRSVTRGRDLRAHGRCDVTGSVRASSVATSSPTSSRLPMKKWSTSLTIATLACGTAA